MVGARRRPGCARGGRLRGVGISGVDRGLWRVGGSERVRKRCELHSCGEEVKSKQGYENKAILDNFTTLL